MVRSRGLTARPRLLVTAMLAAIVVLGVGPLAHPSSVAASTASTMEAKILSLVNAERTKRGLVPLRLHAGLVDLAGDRAAEMASTAVFAHPSCLSCLVDSRNIQYYRAGEIIAWTGWPWGAQAAQSLFDAWKGSPLHWGILMSAKYNYIGFGVAYRGANKRSYAAGLLTESKDQTKPSAKLTGSSRKGTTVKWTWSGADPKLQTHTAGLKSFDVQYRVGKGTWRTIRAGTTATSLTLKSRAHGHWYWLRVRARDNAGNVSAYSAGRRIWVP
jgi:uncharacterized protein YkwD